MNNRPKHTPVIFKGNVEHLKTTLIQICDDFCIKRTTLALTNDTQASKVYTITSPTPKDMNNIQALLMQAERYASNHKSMQNPSPFWSSAFFASVGNDNKTVSQRGSTQQHRLPDERSCSIM